MSAVCFCRPNTSTHTHTDLLSPGVLISLLLALFLICSQLSKDCYHGDLPLQHRWDPNPPSQSYHTGAPLATSWNSIQTMEFKKKKSANSSQQSLNIADASVPRGRRLGRRWGVGLWFWQRCTSVWEWMQSEALKCPSLCVVSAGMPQGQQGKDPEGKLSSPHNQNTETNADWYLIPTAIDHL